MNMLRQLCSVSLGLCQSNVTHTVDAHVAMKVKAVGFHSGKTYQVVIVVGSHLFPFRTEKLSPLTPMVLQCNAGE